MELAGVDSTAAGRAVGPPGPRAVGASARCDAPLDIGGYAATLRGPLRCERMGRTGSESSSSLSLVAGDSADQPVELPEMRYAVPRGNRLEVTMPELRLAPYGEGVLDVVCLAHNAIRRDAMDFLYLLAFVQRSAQNLRGEDMIDFFRWVHEFGDFVNNYFGFEQDVLFPWLTSHGVPFHQDKVLNEKTRHNVHRRHRRMMRKLWELEDRLEKDVPIPVSIEIVKKSEKYISSLVNYCAHEEETISSITEGRCGDEEKEDLETRLFQYILRLQQPVAFFTLLIRPFEDEDNIQQFTKSFMRRVNPLLRSSFRVRMARERKKFQTNHIEVAKMYFEKWSSLKV